MTQNYSHSWHKKEVKCTFFHHSYIFLSISSPFTNNAYKDQDCVAARRQLDSDHGDPITLLNSFREWLEIKATNRDSSKKWCKKRGLEEQVR